jgi:hypothetical protein
MGYSFGGTPNFPGQRFAARLADDPLGMLTFRETVLVNGEASQTNGFRWEDYPTTTFDGLSMVTIHGKNVSRPPGNMIIMLTELANP